jgi:tetratricopeptide (TPR) repeat protein
LVELGDRYWQEGDKTKAQQTWSRIKIIVPDKARANEVLGEVYLEHDMPQQAIEALREAMKLQPKAMKYKKAYALALERTGASAGSVDQRNRQYDEARKIWEAIAKEAGDSNEHAAREARQHIVTLWGLSGQLEQRAVRLDRRLKQTPPDLEAGRLLAEVQIRLRRYADAERTLAGGAGRQVIGSLTQLERVDPAALKDHCRPQEAHRGRPARPRYYQRAGPPYQDDDAINTRQAVELTGRCRRAKSSVRCIDDAGHPRAITLPASHRQEQPLVRRLLQLAELLMGQGGSTRRTACCAAYSGLLQTKSSWRRRRGSACK